MDTLTGMKRTDYCGNFTAEQIGQEVTVYGWAQRQRDLGNLIFIDLRDRTGILQLSFNDATDREIFAKAQSVRSEYVLAATGTLQKRESVNKELKTGEIELAVTDLRVLSKAQTPPFEIANADKVGDETTLKYRYLHLRNERLTRNLLMRHKIAKIAREYFYGHDFVEIETPMLIKSTPEGARDYVVPSRVHKGKFYALPQSPQIYKQLCMIAGLDRYIQLARCFRDEDLRADRQPEFTQIDLEMSFVDCEDIMQMAEGFIQTLMAQTVSVDIAAPLPRMTYADAMARYGSDKPDLRIDLTCKNVSALFENSEFEALRGQTVKMVDITDCALTRKQIEKLLTDCEVQSGSKAYWFKVDENGQLAGGIAKFVAPVEAELGKIIDLKPGTLVLATAGQYATKSVGVLIKTFGAACENHFDKERYEFCWIVDFPMYEIGDESGELEFCHNPFSMPNGGMDILLKAERGEIDPLDIYANQYDLVCNGVELSSGAVRNHDPEIMIKAFELVRLGEEDVKKKFPAMYNAFCYGAPPHAGIAPGVDRMVMLLAGESSIREIIPFPMNKNAQDVMMSAPSEVTQKQLDELHIAIVKPQD